MKKLLIFILLSATNIFCQNPEAPDAIAIAIENNLNADLIEKAIIAKKPTLEEIKRYQKLSTNASERLARDISSVYTGCYLKNNKEALEKLDMFARGLAYGSIFLYFASALGHRETSFQLVMSTFAFATIGIIILFLKNSISNYRNSLQIKEFLENYKPQN